MPPGGEEDHIAVAGVLHARSSDGLTRGDTPPGERDTTSRVVITRQHRSQRAVL